MFLHTLQVLLCLTAIFTAQAQVLRQKVVAGQHERVHQRFRRVVNGYDSNPHGWPWQVSLQRGGSHFCGGSLISNEWVLTAAHCVHRNLNPRNYTIIVGAHKLYHGRSYYQRKFHVKEIFNHTGYHGRHKRHDVALVRLDGKIRVNRAVRPVAIPVHGDKIHIGKRCYMTGWGDTSFGGKHSNSLQEAQLIIKSSYRCKRKNGRTVHGSTMICAGGHGQGGCHGDSGGPFVCHENGRWILRGVASWANPSCSTKHFTVFARVSSFVNWIRRVQNKECHFYQLLNSVDRAQGIYNNSSLNPKQCDRHVIRGGWYRFTGMAGYKMPSTCVPVGQCGTDAPGWMLGTHPTPSQGVVTRRVCYHWNGDCTRWSNTIKVRNCGHFYVYNLVRPAGCNFRYCGNGRTTAPECLKYKILSSLDRAQSQPSYSWQCDADSLTENWYRFAGQAGTRIATSCVPIHRCGTSAPGWMQGTHPAQSQGVVSRAVCYNFGGYCCFTSNYISVRNCGGFYVYRLVKPPGCYLRYCGNGEVQGYKVMAVISSVCKNYKLLNTRDRAQSFWHKHQNKHCDRRDITNGYWYRFAGQAGSMIATSCVRAFHCGTHAPGWMTGFHPTLGQGVVIRRVCYHWKGQCCHWSSLIHVRNCGGYYVYQLYRPRVCSLRYCGNGNRKGITN